MGPRSGEKWEGGASIYRPRAVSPRCHLDVFSWLVDERIERRGEIGNMGCVLVHVSIFSQECEFLEAHCVTC